MNAIRKSPPVWSTCRKVLCAAGLAALASSALADAATEPMGAKAEIPAVKSHKASTWVAPARAMSVKQMEPSANWYAAESYMAAMENFNSVRLFRTRKELQYRDALRLLLTKRQLRVWLREDLHVQCEIKRYHTMDDGRELGLKLSMYYRFD